MTLRDGIVEVGGDTLPFSRGVSSAPNSVSCDPYRPQLHIACIKETLRKDPTSPSSKAFRRNRRNDRATLVTTGDHWEYMQ